MLRAISKGATHLYHTAVSVKNHSYDHNLKAATRIEGATVISIGALRAGGSGKTPLAILLASELHRRGARPAIVLRGYRGALEYQGGMVSCGDGPLVSPAAAGDEAFLIAHRIPRVPVFVGADRIASARRAVTLGCRVIVLDDGFSHRRIARDMDLLLAAPEDLQTNTALLPHGPLREPARSAQRADVIAGLVSDWSDSTRGPELLFEHLPTKLVNPDGEPCTNVPQGASIWAVACIARPNRFLESIGRSGHSVQGYSFFRDHQPLTEHHWNEIYTRARHAGAQLIVTTEKDLFRGPISPGPLPVHALRIESRVARGQEIWEKLLDRLTR